MERKKERVEQALQRELISRETSEIQNAICVFEKRLRSMAEPGRESKKRMPEDSSDDEM